MEGTGNARKKSERTYKLGIVASWRGSWNGVRFKGVRTWEGKLMYRRRSKLGESGAISYVFLGIFSVDKYEGKMQ